MANLDERQKEIQNNNSRSQNEPETLTNPIYTPAFLKEQIGKLMRVEFLIGTYMLTDRIGVLEEVGASYIILRSFESDSIIYCDIYSIKFITMPAAGYYNQVNMNMNMNMAQMNMQNGRYQY